MVNTSEQSSPTSASRPCIVVIGAGFGGLFTVRGLARVDADIILVDQNNYHLFQPLLYQVATAGLAPSDIAWPIRGILSRQQNVTVLLHRVVDIDTLNRQVVVEDRRIDYDYLVVATGVRHSYFGNGGWEQQAPGLKNIEDATAMRRRLLLAFERAEMTQDPEERRRLLNFVVIGGGPTGVELAGAIAELARKTLAADFRRIDPGSAHVLLLEAGPRILPALCEELSAYSLKALNKLGVEVRCGHAVSDCNADGVVVDGQQISAATLLWAAGIAASPAGNWLGAQVDRAGRVLVARDLSVPGLDNIYAIGDTAAVFDDTGNLVPGIAPAAKQQGRYVATAIAAHIAASALPGPFVYRHAGNLATVGRKSAVIEFPRLRLQGFIAWWIWGIAHIYFLIGLRSPVLIAMNWLWQYLTYRRGARLITGRDRK
jgi:NADH dehydrogenase